MTTLFIDERGSKYDQCTDETGCTATQTCLFECAAEWTGAELFLLGPCPPFTEKQPDIKRPPLSI